MKPPNCMQTGTLLESLPTRGSKKERGWFRLMLKERHPPRPQHLMKLKRRRQIHKCQTFSKSWWQLLSLFHSYECPIGSDIILALYENLGPHIYRQFEGTSISPHVETTLPFPERNINDKPQTNSVGNDCYFFIHMQIESPIGSDMRLALYKNLEGTSISPHGETTPPASMAPLPRPNWNLCNFPRNSYCNSM